MAKPVIWYYDVISPFAYMQATRLGELPSDVDLTCRPTLFAGLLNHWGQLGPAEIPSKKVFTFRHSLWRARKAGIPYKTPKQHPFNPLRALRLAISFGADLATVQRIFHCIWVEGLAPDNEEGWVGIQSALGIDNGDTRTADPAVKAALLANGDDAISKGVFGVPSFVIDGEIFWGDDAFEMVLDYLSNPALLAGDEMKELSNLQPSATRR